MNAQRRQIAVVLVSGGMDSCVSAAEARNAGFDLAFLHASYGQRTQARELRSFHAIADRMGVPGVRRLVVNLPHLGAIGGSSLTDRSIQVAESPLATAPSPLQGARDGLGSAEETPAAADRRATPEAPMAGAEAAGGAGASPRSERKQAPPVGAGHASIPSSYVPFRNAHFLVAAVSWGEVLGASAIYIGAVEEDSSGYPDCREEYFRAFERAVDLGTRPETRIRIVTPLIHMDKADIVRRGVELGAPFELTWSCYQAEESGCGVCDSCALRLRGFARAGAADPIPYARGAR